jgi:tetratricopeptide (TPR) repeat protein
MRPIEIEERQADEDRLQEFHKLARDALAMMSCAKEHEGDRVAVKALKLYRVLEEKDWLARLEKSYLTEGQKQTIREMAYFTLVSLADFEVRWDVADHPRNVPGSLDFLERAKEFHEPTRAFYFVRSECHRLQGNTAAAEEDKKQFRAAVAGSAWDYFLPGHTAGWNGDFDEAIRSYNKALAIDPKHANSLYFQAECWASDKKKGYRDAIGLFTGYIALTGGAIWAIVQRAECHQKLGHLGFAEDDYTTNIEGAKGHTDKDVLIEAYRFRQEFYDALGDAEKARQDLAQIILVSERWLENEKPVLDHSDPLWMMNCLAVAYHDAGRLEKAIALHKELLEKRNAKLGPDHPDTLYPTRIGLAHPHRIAGIQG